MTNQYAFHLLTAKAGNGFCLVVVVKAIVSEVYIKVYVGGSETKGHFCVALHQDKEGVVGEGNVVVAKCIKSCLYLSRQLSQG